MVSDDIVFVSESGIKTYDDIKVLEENNVNAVLIGETLMKSHDKRKTFEILQGLRKPNRLWNIILLNQYIIKNQKY